MKGSDRTLRSVAGGGRFYVIELNDFFGTGTAWSWIDWRRVSVETKREPVCDSIRSPRSAGLPRV
jgi:hypothetical protein